MVKPNFLMGFLTSSLLICGCASAFNYHYFGLSEVTFAEGKLLGPTPADDLPFNICAPNSQSKSNCVIMLSTEFFAFKKEYESLRTRLKSCKNLDVLSE